MRTCTCPTCNAKHAWSWENAFLREGFFNGADSQTETVAEQIRAMGYVVSVDDTWEGNPYIDNVAKPGTGISLIKETDWPGEKDPRDLLDGEIIKLLDEAFPEGAAA